MAGWSQRMDIGICVCRHVSSYRAVCTHRLDTYRQCPVRRIATNCTTTFVPATNLAMQIIKESNTSHLFGYGLSLSSSHLEELHYCVLWASGDWEIDFFWLFRVTRLSVALIIWTVRKLIEWISEKVPGFFVPCGGWLIAGVSRPCYLYIPYNVRKGTEYRLRSLGSEQGCCWYWQQWQPLQVMIAFPGRPLAGSWNHRLLWASRGPKLYPRRVVANTNCPSICFSTINYRQVSRILTSICGILP